jgi:transcriptional regulator with XRE-family HTH domain
MNFRQALGQQLQETRNQQRLTLRELAERCITSKSYISEIERGIKEPSSEMVHSLCDALSVPVADVVIRAGIRLRQDPASDRLAQAIY